MKMWEEERGHHSLKQTKNLAKKEELFASIFSSLKVFFTKISMKREIERELMKKFKNT